MTERVLVSGGSGGIGAALCRRLAVAGCRPVIGFAGGRDRAAALALETGGEALALDLADDAAIEAAVIALAADPDPLRGVVLAASPRPVIAPFGQIAAEDMALQWRINVEGPRRLLAGVVKGCFRKNKRGTVVALLSAAMGEAEGKAASGMGSYVIAKYGLKGVLAAARGDFPWLKTATLSPGYTETPMLECFDPRFLDLMRAQQAEGRFATPEEVAAQLVALVLA
jgi:3-oxoacyl-[acyl-carrier protein] reductase